jgi:hypothetical protein
VNVAQQSISMPVFLDVNLNCPSLAISFFLFLSGYNHYLLDLLACNDGVSEAFGLVGVLWMRQRS